MSTQTIIDRANARGLAQRSPANQIERFDRLIREAEARLDEQEAYVREASLTNCNTAVATFEVQKMHLLVALLRESRQRLVDRDPG